MSFILSVRFAFVYGDGGLLADDDVDQNVQNVAHDAHLLSGFGFWSCRSLPYFFLMVLTMDVTAIAVLTTLMMVGIGSIQVHLLSGSLCCIDIIARIG